MAFDLVCVLISLLGSYQNLPRHWIRTLVHKSRSQSFGIEWTCSCYQHCPGNPTKKSQQVAVNAMSQSRYTGVSLQSLHTQGYSFKFAAPTSQSIEYSVHFSLKVSCYCSAMRPKLLVLNSDERKNHYHTTSQNTATLKFAYTDTATASLQPPLRKKFCHSSSTCSSHMHKQYFLIPYRSSFYT